MTRLLAYAPNKLELDPELIAPPEGIRQPPGDLVFFLGALFGVAAIVFLVAYLVHRRSRRPRRKRRERRPRRPTLAETGGLPPIRSGSGNSGE